MKGEGEGALGGDGRWLTVGEGMYFISYFSFFNFTNTTAVRVADCN